MDAWVYRLKDAYDAGYYRTEAAPEAQTSFPWQNKTCGDCPFWSDGMCLVFAEDQGPWAHTCVFFDRWHRDSAGDIVRKHRSR
jgi:hypothetical protein